MIRKENGSSYSIATDNLERSRISILTMVSGYSRATQG